MNKQSEHKQHITVQNEASDSNKLSDFFNDYVKTNRITDEIYNDLQLAIEETFINITNYAFSDNQPHTITIEFVRDINSIHITFIDNGIAFNPLTDCKKNIINTDHCEGGMGIHLIKSLTDKQEYKRIEQQNVFTVTKHYNK